jgi:hypothetical protein
VLEQPPPPQVAASIRNAASFTDPARLPIVTYSKSSTVSKLLASGVPSVTPHTKEL